jgi:hypothetical protein
LLVLFLVWLFWRKQRIVELVSPNRLLSGRQRRSCPVSNLRLTRLFFKRLARMVQHFARAWVHQHSTRRGSAVRSSVRTDCKRDNGTLQHMKQIVAYNTTPLADVFLPCLTGGIEPWIPALDSASWPNSSSSLALGSGEFSFDAQPVRWGLLTPCGSRDIVHLLMNRHWRKHTLH